MRRVEEWVLGEQRLRDNDGVVGEDVRLRGDRRSAIMNECLSNVDSFF